MARHGASFWEHLQSKALCPQAVCGGFENLPGKILQHSGLVEVLKRPFWAALMMRFWEFRVFWVRSSM